ncbi:hypothetical protein AWB78_07348 [Caballeronia calidae]|uniref:PIN like domain-containing protein n=1 Tax=Caballeronia calidae TaxID=1777139 RepID=A0A158EE69_9BURK|nr:PIN-like domain-containing protein [Caballeronia calidae]SAL05192.1 hypothetical protein AWB78_07348 [Caballeronia calidae]
MKQIFFGHYRPEQQLVDQMWAEGTFVFDANALLNVYRYTDTTRDDFMRTLEALRERVWIPYQVGLEFFRNRPTVISAAASGYAKLRDELEKCRDDLRKALNAFRRHPGIDVEQISQTLDVTFTQLKSDLEGRENRHPDWMTGEDPLLSRLTTVFHERVGEKPDAVERKKLLDQAKSRFDTSQPPGLCDRDKGWVSQYGDAVLWLEILQKASVAKSPIIFVTDDVKEDWWQRASGKTIGPLPELRQELWDVANVPLHMYNCDQFLKYASKFLHRALPESSIAEAEEVRNELQRRSHEDSHMPSGEIMEALYDLIELAPPRATRPGLVSDYRGPTVAAQISNLVAERSRLAHMFVSLPSAERRSDKGRAIREALDFVDREILDKGGRAAGTFVDEFLDIERNNGPRKAD